VRRAHRPDGDLPDVFLGAQAVAQGLLTRGQLRGPLVARVLNGVYRPAWVPDTHALRCRAAALVLPPASAVTGRSAVTFLGVPLAGPGDPVEVVAHETALGPRRAGVLLRRSRVPVTAIRVVDDVPLADPMRIGLDLATGPDLATSVAHLDAAVREGLLVPDDLRRWLEPRRDNRIVQARCAANLIDPRAESLPESRIRVVLRTAGYDVVPQHEVWHRGRFVARVDLALVALRIAIEYDGAWHALREQLARDRERMAALAGARWLTVHVTATTSSSAHLLGLVGAAVRQRAAEPR
jgi:very-short-patch-repair endonuclease